MYTFLCTDIDKVLLANRIQFFKRALLKSVSRGHGGSEEMTMFTTDNGASVMLPLTVLRMIICLQLTFNSRKRLGHAPDFYMQHYKAFLLPLDGLCDHGMEEVKGCQVA